MNSQYILIAGACAILTLGSGVAFAQDAAAPSAWSLGGSAALTSDYVFRGFSQTDEGPAVQAGVSLNHDSGFSASLWGSNVDFNDGDEASVEVDGTLSYTHDLGPGKATVGGIYYAYPGADSDLDYDYMEAFAGYALNVAELADVSAQFFYSPDFFASSGDAQYVTAGVSVPVKPVDGLAVVGSAGYQWIDDNAAFGADDYTDWSAGVSYTWEMANFSVKYYGTDVDNNDLADDRVVAAVTISFP